MYFSMLLISSQQRAFAVFNSGPFRDAVVPPQPDTHTQTTYTMSWYRYPTGSGFNNGFFRDDNHPSGAQKLSGPQLYYDDHRTNLASFPGLGHPVVGNVYLSWADDANFETASMTITTIFGLLNGSQLIGFDPPSASILSEQGDFGISGAFYPSNSNSLVSVSELATTYPTFDVSDWTGDPNRIVSVFTTTVPMADFIPTPEPGSLLLLITAIISVAGNRPIRNRR